MDTKEESALNNSNSKTENEIIETELNQKHLEASQLIKSPQRGKSVRSVLTSILCDKNSLSIVYFDFIIRRQKF
jgi:hypothetical protein